MKLLKNYLIAAFLLVLVPSIFAGPAIDKNLFYDCIQGSSLRRCRLDEGIVPLIPSSSPFERIYKVKYLFPCKGHDPYIGIKADRDFQKFNFTQEKMKLILIGQGALEIKDLNVSRTLRASLTRDCYLKLTSVEVDLSPNSKNTLNSVFNQRDRLTIILDNLTNIESSAGTILSLVTQLNPSQILSLMQGLRKDVITMHEITPDRRDKRTLQGVIDLIDNKNAENPGLNDGKLKETITNVLNDLIKIAPTATDLLQEEIEDLNVRAEEMLSYASEATQREYQDRM